MKLRYNIELEQMVCVSKHKNKHKSDKEQATSLLPHKISYQFHTPGEEIGVLTAHWKPFHLLETDKYYQPGHHEGLRRG